MTLAKIYIQLKSSISFDQHPQIKTLDRIYQQYGGVKLKSTAPYVIYIDNVPMKETKRIIDSLPHDISHEKAWKNVSFCPETGAMLIDGVKQ